jgi:hypothetical protein
LILSTKRTALNNSLIVVFSAFAGAMLLQSYKPILPLTIYILLIILFVSAIAFSILFGKEFTAAVGIFAFSIVIRLMYFVSTRFQVFAYGDAYSQYSVLRYFSQTSHVSIFINPSFLNFLTRIPHQYSEWPGFEAFSLSLSRVTGLPLFATAMAVPFLLYAVWFVISYALLRTIFRSFRVNASKLSLLSIAIAAAFPTFEQPPEFKYDFMAALLLLALILVLIHPWEQRIFEKSVLLVILTLGIVVTHSLTSLFLVMIVVLLGVAFVVRALLPVLIPRAKRWSIVTRSSKEELLPFLYFLLFVLGSVAVWWIYYASFVAKYGLSHLQYIFTSFSFKFLSSAAGGSRKAAVAQLTPSWLLELLHFRDDLLLALVAIGTLLLFIRPRIFGTRLLIPATLLSVAVVSLVTEVSHVLNFGDRSFLTFAPILACFVIMPVAAIASRKLRLAKLGGILILFLFLFSVGLGFWGSTYAPIFLYSSRQSPYAFGEHPTNWDQVAAYMRYSTGSSSNSSSPGCILTNEVWVTSLVLPVQELKSAYPFPNIRTHAGCITIIYQTLLYFNSSSISPEPYLPYKNTSLLPAFSDAKFFDVLGNQSDLIFNGGNNTIYYTLK